MSEPGTIEATIIDNWLHATLDGDPALRAALGVSDGQTRVSPAPAPAEWGTGPFVTYEPFGPVRDVRGVGTRISATGLWIVKGVMATASYEPLMTTAARIDTLLEVLEAVVVVGGTILACHREETVHYPENDGAVEWRHLGGLYRIRAQ